MNIIYGNVSVKISNPNPNIESLHHDFSIIYPELKNSVPRLEIDASGEKSMIYDGEIYKLITYLCVGKETYSIKNNGKAEAERLAKLHRGDLLSIKGLGTIQIVSIFNYCKSVENVTIEELGIYCSRVII